MIFLFPSSKTISHDDLEAETQSSSKTIISISGLLSSSYFLG